ncbi:MAG: peptidoglycan bridge formation glycyltransferase FemA/FemB family protein [Solobacterium sp.]|nr:peptidoglycan bridge formation glycyltransferase FemA/FemB family protein [Solobacterium sp.]
MKFVTNVDPKRFDAFARSSSLNHYSKTSPFIAFKYPEYQKGELLGVEDENGELIATAVMLEQKTRIPGIRFNYVQYGFNLDIEDRELIRFFAGELYRYAENKGSAFLRMDFNITRLEHDKNGNITENGFNHEYITDILKDCGYTHLGYNYGYSGNWMSRFTYRLDLDRPWKEITKGIKRFNYYTNKNKTRCVRVHKAGKDELNVLVNSQEELSEKLGFKPKDLAYFSRLWDCYADDVHYYVVSTNYHTAKLNILKELQETEEHKKLLKDPNRIEAADKNIQAMQKEIREIEEGGYDVDKEQVLGAKFIIKQDANVWNVNMYTNKTLMNFRSAFTLHSCALQDLYEQGAKTYDFEGISGSMDPKDEYYGQTDFKKSFGGDYLEFLGEFDAVFRPKKYEAWKKINWFKSHARRRLRYMFYKKKS